MQTKENFHFLLGNWSPFVGSLSWRELRIGKVLLSISVGLGNSQVKHFLSEEEKQVI